MPSAVEPWYARPVFFVGDCEEALRFYARPGFVEDWRHEEEGTLVAVQVTRNGAELILNRNARRAAIPSVAEAAAQQPVAADATRRC